MTPQPGELALPLSPQDAAEPQGDDLPEALVELPPTLVDELWRLAQGDAVGLGRDEFERALVTVGTKYRYGVAGVDALPAQRESFLRGLQLVDLALAQGCALGREVAWQQFLARYRGPLQQAAVAITRSSSSPPSSRTSCR